MTYDRLIIDTHVQKDEFSCIPSAVEMILKLLRRVPVDYYDLQNQWQNKKDGSFSDFDGTTCFGVTFTHKKYGPRWNGTPTDKLFNEIDGELGCGRYVPISIWCPPYFHNYIVFDKTDREYLAFSKNYAHTVELRDIRRRVEDMKGTDILTYCV